MPPYCIFYNKDNIAIVIREVFEEMLYLQVVAAIFSNNNISRIIRVPADNIDFVDQ